MKSKVSEKSKNMLNPQNNKGLSTVSTIVSTSSMSNTSTSTPQGSRTVTSPTGMIQLGIKNPIKTK